MKTHFIISALLLLCFGCKESGVPQPKEVLDPEELIKQDYHQIYLATETIVHWDGDISLCKAGTTDPLVLDKVLRRINYFRNLAGLDPARGLRAEWNQACQEAALMMESNYRLSHYPSPNWKCYTDMGALAASSSNLSSSPGATSITSFMRDAGSNNTDVGHRRWILNPEAGEFGFGSSENYSVLWAHDRSAGYDATKPVCWPPALVPAPLVFPRWSFSLAQADFRNARVTMTNKDGYDLICTIIARNGQYGQPSIVWEPESFFDYSQGKYTVKVEDVVVNGKNKHFEYEVQIVHVN